MAGGCGILCALRPPFDKLRAGLGSTSVLSDESGQQAGERVAYLPYGGVRLGDASTLPTDYTFTGQRLEAGLGLMHYGARFYSPRLGRFVSADTIVPRPGDPQSLNRYAYVRNNPVIYRDPSGHAECVDAECKQRVHPISGNIIQRKPMEAGTVSQATTGGVADTVQAVSTVGAWPLAIASARTMQELRIRTIFTNYSEKPWYVPVLRPQREGLVRVATPGAKVATGISYALPVLSGGINYFDINNRQASGDLTGGQASGEHVNNALFTAGNLGITYGLNTVGSQAGSVTIGAVGGGSMLLGSPPFLGTSAAGVAIVTSWEYQTINNRIEGMPPEQAWKSARDTTFEPLLNLAGLTRKEHPEWYWYP